MAITVDTSKTELREMLSRAQGRLARVRDKSEAITGRIVSSLACTAGGATTGLLRNKLGTGADKALKVGGMPVDLVAGVGLALVGAAGGAGRYSDQLCAWGDGMVAGHVAIGTFLHGFPGANR